jgi:ribosomal-protein-alanine N-acetyltransferase
VWTTGTRALETGTRVMLRAAAPDDRDEFVDVMRRSRDLHHPWASAATEPQQFDVLLDRARGDEFEMLLPCRVEDGAITGFFNLSHIVRGALQSAFVGYGAAAPYARQGYMSEGLTLVLRHAFGTLGLHRIEANIQPANEASKALVRSCGFRREGFSPRYLKINGQWRDHERWAALADDRDYR